MREIKFRGKRLDAGEWVYGSLVKEFDNWSISDWNSPAYSRYDVDPATIGQFTGVKAKGIEVYEGDIVRFSTKRLHNKRHSPHEKTRTKWFTSEVVYEDCSFVISETQENDSTLWSDEENAIEVIGNSTDTPHLLDPNAH